MSHGGKWREPCVSRDRDIYRSWLHRLVRLSSHFCISANFIRAAAASGLSVCFWILVFISFAYSGLTRLRQRHVTSWSKSRISYHPRSPKCSQPGHPARDQPSSSPSNCAYILSAAEVIISVFCLTSKMSHEGIWHDPCPAGGVTDTGVGSIALLGSFYFDESSAPRINDIAQRSIRTQAIWESGYKNLHFVTDNPNGPHTVIIPTVIGRENENTYSVI